MKIDYVVTEDDYGNFGSSLKKEVASDHGFYGELVIMIVLVLSFIFTSFKPFGRPALAIYWVFFMLGAVLSYLYYRVHLVSLWKKFSPLKDGYVLGRKSMVLEDDEFRVEGDGIVTTVDYSTVKSFFEDEGYFFVMIDKSAGFIVPKRSFENSERVDHFRSYFKRGNQQRNTIEIVAEE